MLVVDAGPLVAAVATRDRNHQRCAELLASEPGSLLVPVLVVTEVAYFLQQIGEATERAFAAAIRAGEFLVEPVEPTDWDRIDQLLETYADLPLGIVDASVVAVCERLGERRLATLDHRHFSVVCPRHCEALSLLPS